MVFSNYNSHLQIANKIQHHWEEIRTILHSPNREKDPKQNEAPFLYTKPITLADSPTRSKEHAKVCLLEMPATLHTCNICCILFHGDANFWFDLFAFVLSLQNILNKSESAGHEHACIHQLYGNFNCGNCVHPSRPVP
jgi:hypothetical protein